MFCHERPAVLWKLRCDRDQRRAEGLDLGKDGLQGCQLCVAVRSPHSTEEREYQRSARQQIDRTHLGAVLVHERKYRHLFTDPEGPFSQAGLLQLLRRTLHNHEAVSGDPFWAFPYGRELFLERHFVVLSF